MKDEEKKEESVVDVFTKFSAIFEKRTIEIIHNELIQNFKKLENVREWADKTTSAYRDAMEDFTKQYTELQEYITTQKKDLKAQQKQVNIHWTAWLAGILLFFSLFFCLGWFASRRYCSYEEVLNSHFITEIDNKVNEIVSEKTKAIDFEAEKIIKDAKNQAKEIILKANNDAAEIKVNSIEESTKK